MKYILSKKVLLLAIGSFFVFGLLGITNFAAADDECEIVSAAFTPSGYQQTKTANQPTSWSLDGEVKPTVQIVITTSNCKQKNIIFSLVEKDSATVFSDDAFSDDVENGAGFDDKKLRVPDDERIVIVAAAGESECESGGPSNETFPDCYYYIEAGPDSMINPNYKSYSSQGKPGGDLTYNCEETGLFGDCFTSWRYISDTSITENGTPVYPESIVGEGSGPCYDEATQDYMDDCYEIISGLPILDSLGNRLDAIKDTKSITGFLNQIFMVAIGIAGVLAVVMIIYHAWSYLTTESITTKVLLKDKLLKIILGILLLFGSVIILRTINPDLLVLDPGLSSVVLNAGSPGGDGEGTESAEGAPTAPTSSSAFAAWAREHGKKITLTKDSGGTVLVSPCDDADMVSITAFGKNLRVQKDIAPLVKRVSDNWVAQGAGKYPIKNIGGYNCRPIANTNKISNHSYGLAIDVNSQENPYIANPANMTRDQYTDMPDSFVNLWKDEGFGWGGDWTSKKDAMHFSKIINEKGDQKID